MMYDDVNDDVVVYIFSSVVRGFEDYSNATEWSAGVAHCLMSCHMPRFIWESLIHDSPKDVFETGKKENGQVM
jgi:hypothetical protein